MRFCDNPKGRPHSESMKEHCQEILFSEIEVLEPDIVVFQVKSKRPTNFEKNLANKFGKEELICGNEGTGAFWYSLRSGKRFIWIWTYHGDGNKYPRNQQNQQINEIEVGLVMIKAVKIIVKKTLTLF